MQEAFLALLGLRVHVRDLDAADCAACNAEGESAARVVGVHVHFERTAVADHEQRVTELLELGLELVGVEPLTFDDEHGAVAEARQLLVDRLEPEILLGLGRRRECLTGDRSLNTAHDLYEARSAGIDDTRLLQYRQHVARLRHGVVTASDDPGEIGAVFGRIGHRANCRQHRSLDRLLHGAVRGVARRTERTGEVVAHGQRLGRTPHDLREDHTGVPARTHQRRS